MQEAATRMDSVSHAAIMALQRYEDKLNVWKWRALVSFGLFMAIVLFDIAYVIFLRH